MIEEEEFLPDLPALVAAIEGTMQDISDLEDYSKITKRQLLLNQQLIFDSIKDIATTLIAKGYVIDILDKAVAHLTTKEMGGDEEEDVIEEAEVNIKNIVSTMFA